MRRQTRFLATFLVFAAATLCAAPSAWAQFGMGGGGFGGGGGQFGGGGGGQFGGGQNGGGQAGVVVNAEGVLKRIQKDPTGRLSQQRLLAARATPGAKDALRSPLRKISLRQLEAKLRDHFANKTEITYDLYYLSGLTRLTHVFYLPEADDIVIAGPAEPFFIDGEGEVRGMDSLRPCLHLEDLVVALRAFPPGKPGAQTIGCSIDPTQEGLNRMQQFLRRIGGRPPRDTRALVNGLQQSLGMQKVSILGISPKTRFAQILLSADYRMKLIGIGLEKPAVRFPSYIDLARSGSKNALVRWYFTPNYECVRVSDDGNAMELVGDGVKLVGADELVNPDGTRNEVGKASGASKRFVDAFTAKYSELSAKEPVYAHLRNLIDMVVAAAYIQQQDFYGKANWDMPVLGSEDAIHTEIYPAPTQVESAVNAVWKGRTLMTPIGGGVNISPSLALRSDKLLADDEGKVKATYEKLDVQSLPAGRWWWD